MAAMSTYETIDPELLHKAGLILSSHPAAPVCPGLSLTAGVETTAGGGLRLRYVFSGPLALVKLPDDSVPTRADGLWQHTCCEAFVAVPGEAVYREFNFSPSGAWAAYRFSDYRSTAALPLGPVPAIACQLSADHLLIDVMLDAAWLPREPALSIGLCAVVETTDGERSYWALAHPAPQPDFHHREGFALKLTRCP